MKTRPLGNTGIDISQIGFGGWGIGGGYYGDVLRDDGIAAVRAYLDAGGNHVDTAYSYQASEEIIGEAIQGYDREKMIITSKTYAACFDRTDIRRIRKELDVSLKGLGTDYLDVYMIHGFPADPDHANALCDEFEAIRDEGKIRVIGASIPGPVVTDERLARTRMGIQSGRIQVLQVNYSIARQKIGHAFAAAHESGVGIIVRWVLESGMLTGKYEPGHEFAWPDTRNRYTAEERDAYLTLARDLKSMLPRGYDNPAQVAIGFALANPDVSGVILGAVNADQVVRNCAVDSLPPLPEELVAKLRDTYGPLNDQFNPTGEFEHVDGRLGAKLR